MRRRSNWVALAGMILLALANHGRVARGQAIGPGFELERAGRYADAASVYFTTIRSDPTNIPALLGLERTLFVLNRMPELLPLGHAVQHEQRALETEERRDVRRIAADGREVDRRGVGVATGAFELEARTYSLTPGDPPVVSKSEQDHARERDPVTSSSHSTGGSTRAPCAAARA